MLLNSFSWAFQKNSFQILKFVCIKNQKSVKKESAQAKKTRWGRRQTPPPTCLGLKIICVFFGKCSRQIDRQINRQKHRKTDRYIDRYIDKYIDRQIDTQKNRQINLYMELNMNLLNLILKISRFKIEYTSWHRV